MNEQNENGGTDGRNEGKNKSILYYIIFNERIDNQDETNSNNTLFFLA